MPSTVPSSLNVTVPLGLPLPTTGFTTALSFAGAPKAIVDGLAESVVLVGACVAPGAACAGALASSAAVAVAATATRVAPTRARDFMAVTSLRPNGQFDVVRRG